MLNSHLKPIWWLNPIIWWLNHLKSHFILISHGKNGKIPIFPILWWLNQLNPIKSLGHWAKSCLLPSCRYLHRAVRGRVPGILHQCRLPEDHPRMKWSVQRGGHIYTIFIPCDIHWCGENDDKPMINQDEALDIFCWILSWIAYFQTKQRVKWSTWLVMNKRKWGIQWHETIKTIQHISKKWGVNHQPCSNIRP